jgi:transglutaminase-like putative cysteine protease
VNTVPLREVLTDRMERLLLACVFWVALPHAWNLDAPVFLFFSFLVAWRWAALRFPALLPGRPLLFLATLAGGALVYFQYQRFYGRDGGAALLLVGLGLKLLEMRTRREVYLAIDLVFFVALTQYLFSQTIPMALYTLAAVVLAVAVLVGVNGGPALSLRDILRRAVVLVGQAIPMMIVLFLFFPRIAGPLWALPEDGGRAKTGLDDTLEPGSVSRLGQSREPAFRVDFPDAPPPSQELYWRGPVFWQTDGRRWSVPPEKALPVPPPVAFTGPSYRYAITLEPHRRLWVFALELPAAVPAGLGQTAEFLLLADTKVADRRRFELVSRPQFRTGPLEPAERARGLQLPPEPLDRARTLVESWRAGAGEPKAVVARSLRFFREQPFVYTLSPPALPDQPVERFLFETRRGFCEHYATSFVILMRLAGIPARVVTGYQGGQWNPVGRFLEVRQADAHAWAEVWLDGKGWTRIDPTAAVSPDRIERGIDVDLVEDDGSLRFNGLGEALAGEGLGLQRWLRESRLLWASVDHAWNRWVLSYDPERQKRFWSHLGIEGWRGVLTWLYALMAVCLLAALLWFHPGQRPPVAPEVRLYRRFAAKLARRGIARGQAEGPLDFARRAAAERPAAAAGILEITELFLALRYGPAPTPAGLRRLRQRVRKFQP